MSIELYDTSFASKKIDAVLVTLVAGIGQGPNVPCRSCLIKPDSANGAPVFVGGTNPATANSYQLTDGQDTPMPVQNLNELFFYSTNATAKVRILWRL